MVEVKENEAKTQVSHGRTNPPVYRGDFLGNWSEKVMDGQIPEFLVKFSEKLMHSSASSEVRLIDGIY